MFLSKLLKRFRKKQDEMIDIHIKYSKPGSMLTIYKLFHRYNMRSFFDPFFTFVFPILIYAILGSLMDYKIMFAGVVAMTGMSGLTSMPAAMLELKQSVILKRIGASPIKTSKFTFVIVSYFTLEISLAIVWLILWALILHQDPSMFSSLGTVTGLLSFLYGNLLNIVLSISLGFFLVSVSKSQQQAQVISMLLMFVAQFLSGMFITINVIASNEVMNWISRLIPYRYSTMYLVSSQININPFTYHDLIGFVPLSPHESFILGQQNPTHEEPLFREVIFYKNWETIMGYIYPWSIICVTSLLSIKKFTWSNTR